jgi:uncharacterized small protein (DUF1192 family)
MDTMKEIMIVKSSNHPETLLEKNEYDWKCLKKLADLFPAERILYSLQVLQDTVAMLPRSFDKRADTEVCMLRLSLPSLEPDVTALTARIAVLEQELDRLKKNGIKAAPAVVPLSAATAAPDAAVSRPEPLQPKPKQTTAPVFEDPFSDASVASAGKYREPQPDLPDPPAKKPAAQAVAAQAVAPVRPVPQAAAPPRKGTSDDHVFLDGWQRLDSWSDVAHFVSREDRILGYLLESSPAVYQGHNIIVIAEDDEDYLELKTPHCVQLMQKALQENRKQGYSVRIEHCSPDKYIPNATIDHLKNSNLFDFGEEPPAEDPE